MSNPTLADVLNHFLEIESLANKKLEQVVSFAIKVRQSINNDRTTPMECKLYDRIASDIEIWLNNL